jgi:hypothetical protein
MNSTEIINDFLAEFGTSIGLELTLDQNGICALLFGSCLRCSIELPENSPTVYFKAPMISLPEIPENKQTQFFKKLLQRNFFCLETRGATFALDENQQQVILCFGQPVAVLESSADFANLLSHFMETAMQWYQELNQPQADQDQEGIEKTQKSSDSLPADTRFWV